MAAGVNHSIVEVAVVGTPRSAQGAGKTTWRKIVEDQARSRIQDGDQIISVDVRLLLIFFHHREFQADLDNVVKPTLDGFATVALGNDNQVAELVVRRTRLGPMTTIDSPTLVLMEALVTAADTQQDFVYIRASDEPVDHLRLP